MSQSPLAVSTLHAPGAPCSWPLPAAPPPTPALASVTNSTSGVPGDPSRDRGPTVLGAAQIERETSLQWFLLPFLVETVSFILTLEALHSFTLPQLSSHFFLPPPP